MTDHPLDLDAPVFLRWLMEPKWVDRCDDPIFSPDSDEQAVPCGDCDGCLAMLGSEEMNPCPS